MQELTSLISSNEKLETEVKILREEKTLVQQTTQEDSELLNDIRRLQAQNSALQKNIQVIQEKYESELSGRPSPRDESDDSHMTTDEGHMTSSRQPDVLPQTNLSLNSSLTLEDLLRQLSELQLSLDTEKEENKMLKDQLNDLEKTRTEQIDALQNEVTKLSEKLKKKQESYLQLQEEKERMYADSVKHLAEARQSKEKDLSDLTEQVQQLQHKLDSINEDSAQGAKEEYDKLLLSTRQKFQERIGAMEISHYTDIQDLQGKLDNATANLQSLHLQCEEDNRQIEAANQLAEKRKNLLDELAIKYQKECDQHREAVLDLENKHQVALDALTDQLQQEREKSFRLEKSRQKLEELRGQLQSAEEAKGWLERRLKEADGILETTKEDYEKQLIECEQGGKDQLDKLQTDHEGHIRELNNEIDKAKQETEDKNITITELSGNIVTLNQSIKDSVDSKKIHEKKGASMMKDLKRQLQSEKRKSEKLQERLQEILTDSKQKFDLHELMFESDSDARKQDDKSSVSSWNASNVGSRDTSIVSSRQSPSKAPSSELEQDNTELLDRITELQSNTWMLEEKVSILEQSNAAMADDILQKQAVINHYSMETRLGTTPKHDHEKLTLKRVVDFVKDKGDENMKDMNRKLQRLLEETLTKNMHLQQNLETISEELMHLKKATDKQDTG